MADHSERRFPWISCLILAVVACWAAPAASAEENLNRLLRGDYAFTGEAVCLNSPNGFSQSLVALGPSSSFSFNVEGVRTFNGDGTGTDVGRNVRLNPGSAGADDFTCEFTYDVAPDLTFTVDVTCSGINTAGPGTGIKFKRTDIRTTGHISKDRRTLVWATGEPNVETFTQTFPNGAKTTNFSICHRSRVGVKVGERD